MKKRLVSLLLALALLVLPVLPAFAAEEDSYTYVALGDSITTGVGLKDTHFSSTAKSYDVQEYYHDYSNDCYVARVSDALGLDRDHAVNYGMPAAMSSNILDLVRTGSTASGVAYYDLPTLRQALAEAGAPGLKILAKIENLAGVQALPEFLPLVDEVVIARGDLGNAMPLWELPRCQKQLSAACRAAGVPFMVVTQMLDSMHTRAVPTRAEVSDIYNAVLDGASSLMLTGETAAGQYPVQAMEYLVRTARTAM